MSQKTELAKQELVKGKDGETDVCNLYKVLLIVECEYISEDSKDRLYLSQVRKIRNPAARIFAERASRTIARLILSCGLTAPFAAWAVVYAFLERGYKAYGGEYLFILMVFGAMYWALGKFFNIGNMEIL